MSQPFSETIHNAPVIVRGTIGMSYAEEVQTSESGNEICTYYELKLTESLKGNISDSTIMIRERGGEKNGIKFQVPGAAEFTRGEDIIIMLKEKNSDGSFDIQEMMLGKYTISMNENQKEIIHDPNTFDKTWTLEQLRLQIQSDITTNSTHNPTPTPSESTRPSDPPFNKDETSSKEEKSPLPYFFFFAGISLIGISLFSLKKRR